MSDLVLEIFINIHQKYIRNALFSGYMYKRRKSHSNSSNRCFRFCSGFDVSTGKHLKGSEMIAIV